MLRCFTLIASLGCVIAFQEHLSPHGKGLNKLDTQMQKIELIRKAQKDGKPIPTDLDKAVKKVQKAEANKIIDAQYNGAKKFIKDFKTDFKTETQYTQGKQEVRKLEKKIKGSVKTHEANPEIKVKSANAILPPTHSKHVKQIKSTKNENKLAAASKQVKTALKAQHKVDPKALPKTQSKHATSNVATNKNLVHVQIHETEWQKYLSQITNEKPAADTEYAKQLLYISIPGLLFVVMSVLWLFSYFTFCLCKWPCPYCCHNKKDISAASINVPLGFGVFFSLLVAGLAVLGCIINVQLAVTMSQDHYGSAWVNTPSVVKTVSKSSFLDETQFFEQTGSQLNDNANLWLSNPDETDDFVEVETTISCNKKIGDRCHSDAAKCITAAKTDYNKTCACFALEIPCLTNAGCFGKYPGSDTGCATMKCGSAICNKPTTVPKALVHKNSKTVAKTVAKAQEANKAAKKSCQKSCKSQCGSKKSCEKSQ